MIQVADHHQVGIEPQVWEYINTFLRTSLRWFSGSFRGRSQDELMSTHSQTETVDSLGTRPAEQSDSTQENILKNDPVNIPRIKNDQESNLENVLENTFM